MATDSATIYREILSKAQSAASAATAALDASRVTLAPVPHIDGLTNEHIQIVVPGQADLPHARSGVGLVEEEFEVAIMKQILRDRFNSYSEAIGDATNSITLLVSDIRGDGSAASASGLHNHVTTNSEGPLVLMGWGTIRQADEDPNWLMHTDRYVVRYELENYA